MGMSAVSFFSLSHYWGLFSLHAGSTSLLSLALTWLRVDLLFCPLWPSGPWVGQELMTSIGEGRRYVFPKCYGLWKTMNECSCDGGGVKRVERNWCGMAAELVMRPASSQTQHIPSTGQVKGRGMPCPELLPQGALVPRKSELSRCTLY